MRTIRHPDLLRYLDGMETEGAIMFVTDPVEPLSDQLHQDPNPDLILWGLYKIANAIAFINNDCGMIHGNVRTSSIFTNRAGEWKLGGLELLSSLQDESPVILTFGGLMPDAQRYASPEIRKSGWTVIKNLPIAATDSYHLGCLIFEAYNRHFETPDQLDSRRGNIPSDIIDSYRSLLHGSPGARPDAHQFLDTGLRSKGFFTTDFIQVNLFLENISIKESVERDNFFRKLDQHINSFPSEFSKFKILPELVKAFEFGSGGAKALNAILKIGQLLPEDGFEADVVPPIVRMFASPDRAIRASLLENMPHFIDHVPKKTVTDQIFPNVATGFTDTVPMIREQTIKSILHLVPKLSDRIINYDLLKYLAKLQMDHEPGIRTNTTICLGKIAKSLTETVSNFIKLLSSKTDYFQTRKKVLIPAFTRGLRDGFHHARIAALMALAATVSFYDAQECTHRILPCVCQILIDSEKSVRTQAFKTLDVFVKQLQIYADAMPETAFQTPGPSSSPMSEKPAEDKEAAIVSMAGVFSGATKGLAGWAVSSLNARMSTPSGDIESATSQILRAENLDGTVSSLKSPANGG
ncbi:armadillo-type protein, partial [Syncephalastrum racemosum]